MNIEFIAIDQSETWHPIAKHFGKQLHQAHVTRFADGETQITLDNQNIWHNTNACIIQTTYPNPHEQILHVAFLAHELKNAGCKSVTAIIPYFSYARQEKSSIPGKSGPAYVVAQLLQHAGIDRVITIESHNSLLKDFFTIPFDSLSLVDLLVNHIKQNINLSDGVSIIAVDKGAHDRAYAIAKQLNCDVIQFSKQRYAQDTTKIIDISGTCKTQTAIIIDDIIDTSGTSLHVCDVLVQQGVKHIFGYFVHPVFSGKTLDTVQASIFEKVFVSNTIAIQNVMHYPKITVFNINNIIIEQISKLIAQNKHDTKT